MEPLDLDVSQLDLDCSNPRHGEVADQSAALNALIANQGRKISNLALDIHTNGISPAQRFIVIENDGRYTALDGNRRLAAVRILSDPTLLPPSVGPPGFPEVTAGRGLRPDRVSCCVLPNRQSAEIWLERIHTGQLDGVGVVPWSPVAQHRFKPRPRRDQTASAVIVSEWLRERIDDEEIRRDINVVLDESSTNLGRLVGDPNVRSLIGFDFDGNELKCHATEEALVRRFSIIVTDLAGETVVAELMSRPDRKQYIIQLLGSDIHADGGGTQLDLDDGTGSTDSTASRGTGSSHTSNGEETRDSTNFQTSSKSKKRARRKAAPRLFQDLEPAGLKTRAKGVLEELQRIDINNFPNASAFLLRSAIEFSVAEYLQSINLDPDKDSLKDRIKKAVDNLKVPKKSARYHGIHIELEKPHSLTSAKNLNSYVHNQSHQPQADDLVTISLAYTVLIQDISDALESNDGI